VAVRANQEVNGMPARKPDSSSKRGATKPRIYAISLKQPWAALLVMGRKTIEVRSWPTRVRGRVLIHAARIPDDRPEAWQWVDDEIRPLSQLGGGIIGEAELLDCLSYPSLESFTVDKDKHLNELSWFQSQGLFGFAFSNAVVVPFRRWAGNVRFFTVEDVR
jgi:ASCH domain